MSKATRNDIPDINAIKEALLSVLSSGRSRSFSGTKSDVSRALELTKEQRSYRIGNSKSTLFENRLVQARVELTKEGLISYKSGKVKLARQGASSPGSSSSAPSTDEQPATATKSKSPDGRRTKCLCIRQPWASYVATGVKNAELRKNKVNVPIRDLVICASKTTHGEPFTPGLVYGMAIGMVDVTECVGTKGDYAWKIENPRLIKPFKVRGSLGFFHVADEPEVIPSNADSYREYVLPKCFRGKTSEEEAMIDSLFSRSRDQYQKQYLDPEDTFSNAKRKYRV